MLSDGGNALDAAIATNAMLAVVYPHMCGLGGDLFLLYHDARTGAVHCLNGSGPAPTLATPEAFTERGLTAVPARGPLPVTVPGAVGAWDAAVRRFGSQPLRTLLAPAITAARAGVPVTDRLSGWISDSRRDLVADPALADLFLDERLEPIAPGQLLHQSRLVRTLERIATAGADDLYRGELADEVDRAVRAGGGLLRAADLAAYRPAWVQPIRARHRGLDVLTTPPNSQGITALLMLNHMAAEAREPGTVEYVTSLVEAKRHAFALRDSYVTDPACMAVGAAELLAGDVSPTVAVAPPPRGDTVYVCTVDAEGNACSLIQSIYYAFGSCFVAGDTGILLHNRGHYFSLDPVAANVIAPGKRTLHTLIASMALEDGRPRFVFGTMGADAQPQTVVQVLHHLQRGVPADQAVAQPRILHGRFALEDDPDVLHVECDYDADALAALRARVPTLNVVPARSERMGHAHAIAIESDGSLTAGADPRSDGDAAIAALN
ncbi:MAG: gamma-glutamyltranspeptidase / glutathione hydrolase [Solirubrobacteraceae bacterium]|nr:gamma-glutamyltranspeptidase / glutathione hydrolase [Solirubrobacteraceae bacterium]